MIEVALQIPKIKWTVFFHFAVTCYNTDDIVHELEAINTPKKDVAKYKRMMRKCTLSRGITSTNGAFKEAVVVTELTSSAREFQNTLQHEIRHLVDNIAIVNHIYDSEDLSDLTGELNAALFPYVRGLLCDECRELMCS